MATYKNIRISKKGGGSRLQRVQVLASGKYKFVKNLKNKVTGKTSKKSKPSKKSLKGYTTMAKKKKRSYRRGSLVQSLYRLAPAVALAAPAVAGAVMGSGRYKVIDPVKYYSGFNLETKQWHAQDMAVGWVPFIATSAVVVGAKKLRGLINRL